MKNILVLLLFLFSTVPVAAQSELTLEGAIKIGLQNNYDIQIARNNARISANNRGRGTAGFLPSLDASGNTQRSEAKQQTNSPFSFGDSRTAGWGAQLTLNWTLFDGFRMFAERTRYRELARLGEYQARDIIEGTVVGISRAYFNLVQQEQLLDVARESRDISGTRLRKEQIRNELGGASSTDLLNAQVAFNNDQSMFLSQRLQVTIVREELNTMLGRDPATEVTVSKEINIPSLDLAYADLQTRAADFNSVLRVARQNKLVADQGVKSARALLFPRLSLQSNYNYSDRTVVSDAERFDEDISTQSTDASVGLFLTFNLFNGARDKIELQNARLAARNQQLALRDTENQLVRVTRETYNTFLQRREIAQLEEQNVLAARQNLNLHEDRFRLGVTTSLEFRDAQVSFIRAQTALIVARYQARITHLEIQRLIGELAVE